MSETVLDETAINAVEKELKTKMTEVESQSQKDFDARVAAAVEKRIKDKEAEVAAKSKDEKIQSEMDAIKAKNDDLQKQIEQVSLRKSVPNIPGQETEEKKEMTNSDKIAANKAWASQVLGVQF